MLLYLIHYKNPEKTQYDFEDVDGELSMDLKKLIDSNSLSPQEKLEKIQQQIEKGTYKLKEIVKYALKNNYYETLKENQYLIQRLIEEKQKEEIETIKAEKRYRII